MDIQAIRMSEIPAQSKGRHFGPFTSAVSATATFSLLVVMLLQATGRI
jgi:hypothetical protein